MKSNRFWMSGFALFLAMVAMVFVACTRSSTSSPTAPEEKVVVAVETSSKSAAWDLSKIVSLSEVRAIAPGTILHIRTMMDARQGMVDMEVKLVRVVDDFQPPTPYIMLEASDPRLIQLGGVAEGMSGSPVFSSKGTMGALSQAFGSQTNAPFYFFATPIEAMLTQAGSNRPRASKPVDWNGHMVVPLGTPLYCSGFTSRGQDFLSRLRVYPGFMQNGMGTAGRSSATTTLVPGGPLAVALVVGDEVTIGAVGTVTYMDGNRLVGFGHPMLGGVGPVELPIIGCDIVAEISSLFAPFKFATFTSEVLGAIDVDKSAGIGGTIGTTPFMVPAITSATLSDGSTILMKHRFAIRGLSVYDQAGPSIYALLGPVANRMDDAEDMSLKIRIRMSFANRTEAVDYTRLYSAPSARGLDLLSEAERSYEKTYISLMGRPDITLLPQEVRMDVTVLDSPLYAYLTALKSDTLATIGTNLTGQVSMVVARSRIETVQFTLPIPDTFVPGIYQLVAESVDRGSYSNEKNPDDSDDGIEEVFRIINRPDSTTIVNVRLSFKQEDKLPVPTPSDSTSAPAPEITPDYGAMSVSVFKETGYVLSNQKSVEVHLVGKK